MRARARGIEEILADEVARRERAEAEADRLRTVLRSLLSCDGMSENARATAMNTLEAGSGDAWLARGR